MYLETTPVEGLFPKKSLLEYRCQGTIALFRSRKLFELEDTRIEAALQCQGVTQLGLSVLGGIVISRD
jgi:hypothetical protein